MWSAISPKSTATFQGTFLQVAVYEKKKIKELKTMLQRQQDLFTKPTKKANAATEASFKVAHILTKHKKPFTDGGIVKEAMTAVAETLFKDHKSKTEILSAIADVQLGANTVARRVSALSADAAKQLESDMNRCKWFSIQCDESVDSSDTAQLAVFIRMVFDDFSTKEEFLTLLPLKTTTRGVDIYNAVKDYFVEKKIPVEKLVSVTTDGAPAMTGCHSGFIASYIDRLYAQNLSDLTMSWHLLSRSSIPFGQRQNNTGASSCSWRNALRSTGISSSTLTSGG